MLMNILKLYSVFDTFDNNFEIKDDVQKLLEGELLVMF